MSMISAEVSKRDRKNIDFLINEGRFPTISDVIRTALRDLFKKEQIGIPNNENGDGE